MSQTLTIPEVHRDVAPPAPPPTRRRLGGRSRPGRGVLAIAALVLLVGLSVVTVALSGVREPLLLPERLAATNPYMPAPSVGPQRLGGTNAHVHAATAAGGPQRLGGTNAHLDDSGSKPAVPQVPTGIVTHR